MPSNPQIESDAALMRRLQAGQQDALAEIARRYQAPLERVARSRLGRADWAEEVVQETFLAALRGCASYDPSYGFRTWLWTILLNQCRRHHRRRARSPRVDAWTSTTDRRESSLPDASDADPLTRLLVKERSQVLESLLARLGDAHADALRLRFFGGLKFQEIADAMGCSLNTAKIRVRDGLLRMATFIRASELHADSTPRDDKSFDE